MVTRNALARGAVDQEKLETSAAKLQPRRVAPSERLTPIFKRHGSSWIFDALDFSAIFMQHHATSILPSEHVEYVNLHFCRPVLESAPHPPSHPPLSWHSCHDTSGLCPNQSHKMPQARWFSVRKLKVLLYDYCLVFSRSVTDSTI